VIAFAAPAALTALVALAVPIVLHLWSRLTGRPLRVGTISWFAAAPPPVARRPKIEDIWLLLLRCGVIAALALALAEPYWRSATPPRSDATWALVAAEVAADSSATPLLDSLESSGADVRVLAKGPIWSLLREADYEAPVGTKFVVVAPNVGADGERPRLRAETQWLVPPLRRAERGTEARKGERRVTIYSDASHRDDAKYVTAALRAAGEATGDRAVITQRDARVVGTESDWIVWLADAEVPEAVLEQTRRGATLVTSGDSASKGTTREGLGRHIAFTGRFHPSSNDFVLQPAFPESMTVLWAGPQPEPVRPIAQSQLVPARTTARAPAAPAQRDLYHAFWLAAVVLFLVERVIAQRARPITA
jgi:hypothetical protein